MGDFFKIFFGICALVIAFVVGKGHGESSYLESEDYKKIAAAKEDLEFSNGELENAKAKLQNIVDRGSNQKTEELLGQILQVFLADLGIQIQNKELILKQAQVCSSSNVPVATLKPNKALKLENKSSIADEQEANPTKKSMVSVGQFKSNEWMLANSNGGNDTLRTLDKLVIKNLNGFLSQTVPTSNGCENFLGVYSGNVKDDANNKNMGSLSFDLKQADSQAFTGKIAWFNYPNPPLTQMINESCGRKAKDLAGRIFNLSEQRYVQIYQIESKNLMAGNFYEVLPMGTTKRVGKFVLKRTDKF
jgi:hypothetical protein